MVMRFFKTVKATEEHAKILAKTLAVADVNELKVSRGVKDLNVEAALLSAFHVEGSVYAIVDSEDESMVFALGGLTVWNSCWFLTSGLVEGFDKAERFRFRLELLKNRNEAFKQSPILFNYIWTGNPNHIRFTESCGARMFPAIVADNGESYVPFEFHREDFEDV